MGGTTKKVSSTPQEIMPLRSSLIDALMSGNVGSGYGTNAGNNPYNQSWMNAQRSSSPTGGTGPRPMMPSMGTWSNPAATVGNMQQYRTRQPAAPQGASIPFLDMLNAGIFAQGPSLDSFADPNGALFSSTRQGYEDMFTQNREEGLAQAKEASGNLTGTGYAANLGGVVNRSLGEQNALMSQILTQLAMAQYGQENANVQNDSQRFMQMLTMLAGGGVSPDTIVQSGGPGALLSPLMSGAGWALGNFLFPGAGGAAGAAAGGALGGR